jgi:hypothetical protein
MSMSGFSSFSSSSSGLCCMHVRSSDAVMQSSHVAMCHVAPCPWPAIHRGHSAPVIVSRLWSRSGCPQEAPSGRSAGRRPPWPLAAQQGAASAGQAPLSAVVCVCAGVRGRAPQ